MAAPTEDPRTDEAQTDEDQPGTTPLDDERAAIRKRLIDRRRFASDVVAYVVVNAFLIGVWAFTGAGYFWPAWVLAGWGVALVLDAWNAFGRRPVTEADVEAELARRHGR